MRLTRIEARDFLAFHKLSLEELSATLSVVVGPNGAGKSSLRRALELAVRAVRWSAESDPSAWERLRGYTGAVRRGAESPSYWVRVGLEMTEPDERELVVEWLRFAVLCTALRQQLHEISPERVDAHLLERVDLAEAAPLFTGALVVLYEASPYERFSVGYEFQFEDETYCLVFRGTGPSGIVRGELEPLRPWPTSESTPSIEMLFADADADTDAATETKPERALSFSFKRVLPAPGELTQLAVTPNQAFQETQVSKQAMRALALDANRPRTYSLDVVFARLLDRMVLLSDQRNGPRHLYDASELLTRSWRAREEDLPLELSRLRLGDHDEQQRFNQIERRFRSLTGADFALRMQRVSAPERGDTSSESWFEIGVDVIDGRDSIPLELSGAGRWEALILSTALAREPGQVIVFDEPATSLHPSLQRTLLREIQSSPAQSLLITHSPFLVPAGSREDLQRIIRIDREGDRTVLHQLAARADPWSADKTEAKLQQLVASSSDVRGLLFARAVILLEGESDFGALEQWLAYTSTTSLPAPHELNVVLTYVGGDTGFRRFTTYLDAFGIPWVIVCDGPALSPQYGNSLCRQVDRAPAELRPSDPEDFAAWRNYWAEYGVYTLADDFSEEIEQLLERADPLAWQAAKADFPNSKIRAGRAFAENSDPPARVREVYRLALEYLRLRPGGH